MQEVSNTDLKGDLFYVRSGGRVLFLSPPVIGSYSSSTPEIIKSLSFGDVLFRIADVHVGGAFRVECLVISRHGLGWIKRQDVEKLT